MPFWVIRRSSTKEECSCALADIEVDVILTGGVGNSHFHVETPRMVFNSQFKLPVITNTRDLTEGDELVLFAEAPVKASRQSGAKGGVSRKRVRTSGMA